MDSSLEVLFLLSPEERKKSLEHSSLEVWLECWDLLDEEKQNLIFPDLPAELKCDIIVELPANLRYPLIEILPPHFLAPSLNLLEPDDLTDIIQEAPLELRSRLWNMLNPRIKAELERLLVYGEEETGSLMTTRYLVAFDNLTVQEVLQRIRPYLDIVERSYYTYVVDKAGLLCGVVSLKELLLAEDSSDVKDVMNRQVTSVNATDDPKKSSELFEKMERPCLPVVDEYRHLVGLLTFDDVIDFMRNEETEEIYKMGGMSGDSSSYFDSNMWQLVLKRLPWLLFLLLTGTLTSNVLQHYSFLFEQFLFLTLFIPVITQTGGNSGVQSSTLIIRGLATSEIRTRDWFKILIREMSVGIIIGLASAVTIFIRSQFFPPQVSLFASITIALALVCVIVFASVMGALVPLLLAKIKFDPTVAAGPLMSTLIDICGLTLYFTIVQWLFKFFI